MIAEDMVGKKLRGSGGYAVANITEEEQKKANLGGPDLFLAGVGRLDEGRFEKYYCNKCEREYEGSPAITYENPNEELGEGVILAEKGEYRCKTCNSAIAQYRKFDTAPQQQTKSATGNAMDPKSMSSVASPESTSDETKDTKPSLLPDDVVPIQSLIGMAAYDSDALHLGEIERVGLRRSTEGSMIMIRVKGKDVAWDNISKIGDIILLKPSSAESDVNSDQKKLQQTGEKCSSCGFQNDQGSAYCAECGARI